MARDRRFAPSRFLRVWDIVQSIADTPGQTRSQLAARFHLCSRQTQADLDIIRTDMGLPLRRTTGYRFDEGAVPSPLTFEDALTCLMLAREGRRDGVPALRVRAFLAKLPALFPPHLQPVARYLLASTSPVGPALADAILAGREVVVSRPVAVDRFTHAAQSLTLRPTLLLPYQREWYVLGECAEYGRVKMLALSTIQTVRPAPPASARRAS